MSRALRACRLAATSGVAAAAVMLAGCERGEGLRSLGNENPTIPLQASRLVQGGEAARARPLLAEHACVTCHAIPGERPPAAYVGPALGQFARRTNIAGSLPNRPETLVRFIMNAPRELPGTGMPDLQVSEAHARDIAALLYTFE